MIKDFLCELLQKFILLATTVGFYDVVLFYDFETALRQSRLVSRTRMSCKNNEQIELKQYHLKAETITS